MPPGASDESMSIGAVWALMDSLSGSGEHRSKIEPLTNACLGTEAGAAELEQFRNHPIVKSDFQELSGNSDELAAQSLSN